MRDSTIGDDDRASTVSALCLATMFSGREAALLLAIVPDREPEPTSS